jgi:hypothetical protein
MIYINRKLKKKEGKRDLNFERELAGEKGRKKKKKRKEGN